MAITFYDLFGYGGLTRNSSIKDRVRTDFPNTIWLQPERRNAKEHKTMNNGTQNTISASADNFIDSTL
jgi:hypothetical protein